MKLLREKLIVSVVCSLFAIINAVQLINGWCHLEFEMIIICGVILAVSGVASVFAVADLIDDLHRAKKIFISEMNTLKKENADLARKYQAAQTLCREYQQETLDIVTSRK